MNELELLKLLGTREKWQRFSHFVQKESLQKDTQSIYQGVGLWYGLNPKAEEIDWDAFTLWYGTHHSGKHKESTLALHRDLINKIKVATPSTKDEEVIKLFVVRSYAEQIHTAAADILKGHGDMDDVAQLVEKCTHEIGTSLKDSDIFVERDLSVSATAFTTGGWEWPIEELNMSVGPLRDKTFVIFGARPEIGKTTFAAHCVAHWLIHYQHMMKGPILWINNEEDSNDVYNRVVQSILGVSSSDIFSDPHGAESQLKLLIPNIDKLLLITRNDTTNTTRGLERLVMQYKPSAIVFDQLDKVEGFSTEVRDDIRLGRLYKWAKSLGHTMDCKVLALSQASDAANNVRYFNYTLLRGSRTDKGAEGDVIITMGREDTDPDGKRYLYVCKNKKQGGPKTDPARRHLKFEAEIIPEKGRYTSYYTERKT